MEIISLMLLLGLFFIGYFASKEIEVNSNIEALIPGGKDGEDKRRSRSLSAEPKSNSTNNPINKLEKKVIMGHVHTTLDDPNAAKI